MFLNMHQAYHANLYDHAILARMYKSIMQT